MRAPPGARRCRQGRRRAAHRAASPRLVWPAQRRRSRPLAAAGARLRLAGRLRPLRRRRLPGGRRLSRGAGAAAARPAGRRFAAAPDRPALPAPGRPLRRRPAAGDDLRRAGAPVDDARLDRGRADARPVRRPPVPAARPARLRGALRRRLVCRHRLPALCAAGRAAVGSRAARPPPRQRRVRQSRGGRRAGRRLAARLQPRCGMGRHRALLLRQLRARPRQRLGRPQRPSLALPAAAGNRRGAGARLRVPRPHRRRAGGRAAARHRPVAAADGGRQAGGAAGPDLLCVVSRALPGLSAGQRRLSEVRTACAAVERPRRAGRLAGEQRGGAAVPPLH